LLKNGAVQFFKPACTGEHTGQARQKERSPRPSRVTTVTALIDTAQIKREKLIGKSRHF
jgi:hypothetical protein